MSFFKSPIWRALAEKGHTRDRWFDPRIRRALPRIRDNYMHRTQKREKARRLRQIQKGQLRAENGLE